MILGWSNLRAQKLKFPRKGKKKLWLTERQTGRNYVEDRLLRILGPLSSTRFRSLLSRPGGAPVGGVRRPRTTHATLLRSLRRLLLLLLVSLLHSLVVGLVLGHHHGDAAQLVRVVVPRPAVRLGCSRRRARTSLASAGVVGESVHGRRRSQCLSSRGDRVRPTHRREITCKNRLNALFFQLPLDDLLLNRSPNIGSFISCWELDELKIAETKALGPLKSRHFCVSNFRTCYFPTRYEWSKIRGTVQ